MASPQSKPLSSLPASSSGYAVLREDDDTVALNYADVASEDSGTGSDTDDSEASDDEEAEKAENS